MILGLGNDLIDIRRIEQTLDRFGQRFLDRIFTPVEQARADRTTGPLRVAAYAKRYAAKEACAKALGTGFQDSVFWRDIGVVNDPRGRPTLVLTGGAKAMLDSLVPAGMVARLDLSMTDEYPMAEAVVIISAVAARSAAG